jgi:hypothetical protein
MSVVATHTDIDSAVDTDSGVEQKLRPLATTPVWSENLSKTAVKDQVVIHTDPVPKNMETEHEVLYLYEPIDEDQMRILTINPGFKGAQLTCSLDVWTRGNPEKYDALSYVWGVENASEKLRIRHEGNLDRYVMVTPNLLTIIKTLRSNSFPRRIWIDALCINQEDLGEKNTQVPMMSRTYGDAVCVRVWLGKEEDDSSVAMDLIRRIPLSIGRFERFIADETNLEDWFALSMLMRRTWFTRRWVLQEIAMASKATIYCGSEKASWSDFVSATQLFQMYADDISKKFQSLSWGSWNYFDARNYSASRLIAATTNFVRRNDSGRIVRRCNTLEDLICNLTSFEATRPHDVIYAVISLADDGPRSSIIPHRNKTPGGLESNTSIIPSASALSVDEMVRIRRLVKPILRRLNSIRAREKLFSVSYDAFKVSYQRPFAHVAAGFIERITSRSLSLDMIFRPWAPENREVPSWIRTLKDTPWRTKATQHPDHRLLHEGSTLIWRRLNADPLVAATPGVSSIYKASGRPSLRPTWSFHQKIIAQSSVPVLYARGFIIDVISHLEDTATLGRVPTSWLKYRNVERPGSDGKFIAKSVSGDFWRTMVANRDRYGANPPPFYSVVCSNVFCQQAEKDEIDLISVRESKLDMIQHEILQRVEEVVLNRRLTRTERHSFLSLVPERSQTGDLICILAGCSVPVVLSKRTKYGDDQGYSALVGESYVHGMMEGEAFDLQSEHGIPWEIFKIV